MSTEPADHDIIVTLDEDDIILDRVRLKAHTNTLNFIVISLAFVLCCITLCAVYVTRGQYKRRRKRRARQKKLYVDEHEAVVFYDTCR